MKNFICVITFFFVSTALCTAAAIAEKSSAGKEKIETSYAFGMLIADDLVDSGIEFNYHSFMQGFKDTIEKTEPRLSAEEAAEKVQTVFSQLQARDDEQRQKEGEQNKIEGAAFLAENAKKLGVIVTASGLQYQMITEGTGEKPDISNTVLVHYRGTRIDGTEFDSTFAHGNPLEVPLAMVIPGWSEGLALMKEGGRAILTLPPSLAYGERGAGPIIGPNSVLIFEVELLSIVRPDEESDDEQFED